MNSKKKSNPHSLGVLGSISFLWKYIHKHKRNFILFYLGWFVDSILTLIMPLIFAIMIDEIVYYKNLHTFLQISFVFVILSIFSCILYFLIYTLHHYLMSMYRFDIRLDLFNQMQSANAAYMSDSNAGDIANIILNDSTECMHFIIRNLFHFFNGVLMCIFYGVYIFKINWQIGLLVLGAAPLSAFVTIRYGRKIRKYSDEQRSAFGSYVGWLYEMLKGIKDIRLMCAQKSVSIEFVRKHRTIFKIGIKTSVSTITAQKAIEFVNLVLQLCIFSIVALLAAKGEITIGIFTVLIAYFTSLKDKIIYLNENNMNMQGRLASIQKVYNFMNIGTENNWKGTNELIVTEGKIEIKSLSFSYDDKYTVIDKLSLTADPGEKLALVGKSGSGKSTIAGLIIGFHTPKEGEIFIDGQSLHECSLRSIRKSIGIVQQEVLIFDGSIKENLLLGNKKATDNELLDACKKAGLIDFVNELQNGINTVVGKDGVGLSGGQKQRIAIARIYLKNPKIIIFDEATSSLDSETEALIHSTWKDLLKDRTTIMIAHRQSSVMLCNNAVLLENGCITAFGTPSELCQNNRSFQELFNINDLEEALSC